MSTESAEKRYTDLDIQRARESDDPLALCRAHPERLEELREFAVEKGYDAAVAAIDAVLEEIEEDAQDNGGGHS